jgi:hypothetical protein
MFQFLPLIHLVHHIDLAAGKPSNCLVLSAPDGVRSTGNISVIEVVSVTNRGSFESRRVGLVNKDMMVKEPPDSKDDDGCL